MKLMDIIKSIMKVVRLDRRENTLAANVMDTAKNTIEMDNLNQRGNMSGTSVTDLERSIMKTVNSCSKDFLSMTNIMGKVYCTGLMVLNTIKDNLQTDRDVK